MAKLHLIKLSVGVRSPEELARRHARMFGPTGSVEHVTRMWPKREAELLDGGSIYWVMKGVIQARQVLLGMQERIDDKGVRRCALQLDRQIVPVVATPRKAFQGWRYLSVEDAPADLPESRRSESPLPGKLARELSEFGLL